MSPRLRRGLRNAALGTLVLCSLLGVALVLAVWREPLPVALATESRASLRISDRGGRLLREVRTRDFHLSAPTALEEFSPSVVPALLAAEDRRFYRHPGVDPLAMARAAFDLVRERRLVSGASTLTQQLARTVAPHPRTFRGKLHEIVVALRIERSLGKQRILEEYLNRVEFGPNLRGMEAASRYYFDKPARALSLGEAAALASIPRGPTLYDPRRGSERLERRRQRVLTRLERFGLADTSEIERARATPLRLTPGERPADPLHLVVALTAGALAPELESERALRGVETTLDAELQRAAEGATRRTAERLREHGASAAAVVVLENATGDVLAYVGSPGFFATGALGQNDGVRAPRQPGSTLKPFVYASAMRELGMTAATLLPDVELSLPTARGTFVPRNYDRRAHGPVLLREALGSSLNVPAVVVANRLGVERTLAALHQAGFASLERGAREYGVALALGDGEVTLIELARAYAMLARGGTLVRERYVGALVEASGKRSIAPASAPERVLDTRIAAVITHVLADPDARASAFGRGNALELPFEVAAKTGTSKGYRDNWSVGYTREVTVAVWVGNFDGSPMVRSSGVTGAGPLFREVMLAAMQGKKPAALVDYRGLVEHEVCTLSGASPTVDCPHRRRELFLADSAPLGRCSFHESVAIDPSNGLRAGPRCTGAEERVFERYPAEYASFAAHTNRPLAPADFSPRCPGTAPSAEGAPLLAFPPDGARFHLDHDGPPQEIVLAARAEQALTVRFFVDGKSVGSARAPFEWPWRLVRGTHRVEAEAAGRRSLPVHFQVD